MLQHPNIGAGLQQMCYTTLKECYYLFNDFLTFGGMKFNFSKIDWNRLIEILLIASIIGFLVFIIVFVL